MGPAVDFAVRGGWRVVASCLLIIAIVVQAVLLAFCVMAYRLTTGEEVAEENITVALLASPERGAQ